MYVENKKLPKNTVEVLLYLVGAKWKIRIVQELLKKEMRFVELKTKIGCTAKVLTNCLKEMERDGLVIREVEGNTIEYYLTDIGYTLKPVIDEMQKWGKEYKRLMKLMEKYQG